MKPELVGNKSSSFVTILQATVVKQNKYLHKRRDLEA